MTSRYPAWLIAHRGLTILTVTGAFSILYNAYFHPLTEKELADLEEYRDPGGHRRRLYKETRRMLESGDVSIHELMERKSLFEGPSIVPVTEQRPPRPAVTSSACGQPDASVDQSSSATARLPTASQD